MDLQALAYYIYAQYISIWFRTFFFTTYNLLSICLAAHLTCCHRNKILKWSLLLSTIINSRHNSFNYLFLSLEPHNKLYRGYASLMTPQLFHWSFFTIKLQARVLATTVGFTKHLTKTHKLLLRKLLRALVSFLLSMRLIILCKNAKSFSNYIPVIYCWTGLLLKYPRYFMSG